MCDHCDVLASILSDLVGSEASKVVTKRVRTRMHGDSEVSAKGDPLKPASQPH